MNGREVCDLRSTEGKREVCDQNINGNNYETAKGRTKEGRENVYSGTGLTSTTLHHETTVPKQTFLYKSFSSARSLALKTRETTSGLSVAVLPSSSACLISGQAERG